MNAIRTTLLATGLALAAGRAPAATPTPEEMWAIIQQQQQTIAELKARLEHTEQQAARAREAARSARQAAEETGQQVEATAAAVEQIQATAGSEATRERFRLGGYGSVRFESNDLDSPEDTFTFRRFVLAGSAFITPRLETYVEIEFERFAQLELEKSLSSAGDRPLEAVQAVEGKSGSEISFEQAWLRYRIAPAFNIDMGGLLVPVGRFNIHHDDNQWNLPRRTLVDRGAPVLPAKAAWPELGIGVSGQLPVGGGLVDYRAYVVNGVELDFELEQRVRSRTGAPPFLQGVLEAELGPTRGGFDTDLNGNKAVTGRVAWRPGPGRELAISGYHGRYTPGFLDDESVWSVGVDGLFPLAGLELEFEGVHTRFEGMAKVGAALAQRAINKEGNISGAFGADPEDAVRQQVEITLAKNVLAESKTGYWVEVRYPFWPQGLNDTVLARGFADPRLIPTARMEQVFYDDLLTSFSFESGVLKGISRRDATLNRFTLGLAYRPVPEWAFQLAGEYTWTGDTTLAGLTNFLEAGPDEDDALAFMFGAAFGF